MAYTVLARKYRSRTFDEVIGQEPIATTLVNAIKAGRIHHGYLFTGSRGVGKTSMARILAKALNCLKYEAPTATPCGECDACRTIAEGQDLDVVEIDAASNTGVDNIRELRSNAAYSPARSRFKVYIIDEVHMLSTGAFNALLKTLEEPPPHVKFILATTELQKVPATIQSRCQRFTFRNIGPDAIAPRLAEIVKEEGGQAEPAVLRRIARLANGSMRDALSILDQVMAVSTTGVSLAALDELIPPPQDEQVFALLDRAAEGDAAGTLKQTDAILSAGRGLDVFLSDVIEIVRTLMLVRACGADSAVVDIPAGAGEAYAKLAGRFELSHFVQMIGMFEELRRNVRFSSAGRALCDAVMVRVARLQQWTAIERLIEGAGAPGDGAAGAGEKKKSLGRAGEASSAARELDGPGTRYPTQTGRPARTGWETGRPSQTGRETECPTQTGRGAECATQTGRPPQTGCPTPLVAAGDSGWEARADDTPRTGLGESARPGSGASSGVGSGESSRVSSEDSSISHPGPTHASDSGMGHPSKSGMGHPSKSGMERASKSGMARPSKSGMGPPTDSGMRHTENTGMGDPDDAGTGDADDGGTGRRKPADGGTEHPTHPAQRVVAVSSEERSRILESPIVQKAMTMFDCVVVNIEKRVTQPADDAAE